MATTSPGDADPSWRVVTRFDHDSTTAGGHDITDEGLHLDVYREGERHERHRDFPILSPGVAMRYCEEFLIQNSDQLLARFERWHGLGGSRERD